MLKIKYSPLKNDLSRLQVMNEKSRVLWWFLKEVLWDREKIRWAIEKLKKSDGEPNMNDYWAVRKGDVVKVFYSDIEYPELYIPYEKFIDLLKEWELVLEQQQNKSAYYHNYNELIIFADDDYNFTVMVDGKMVEK